MYFGGTLAPNRKTADNALHAHARTRPQAHLSLARVHASMKPGSGQHASVSPLATSSGRGAMSGRDQDIEQAGRNALPHRTHHGSIHSLHKGKAEFWAQSPLCEHAPHFLSRGATPALFPFSSCTALPHRTCHSHAHSLLQVLVVGRTGSDVTSAGVGNGAVREVGGPSGRE